MRRRREVGEGSKAFFFFKEEGRRSDTMLCVSGDCGEVYLLCEDDAYNGHLSEADTKLLVKALLANPENVASTNTVPLDAVLIKTLLSRPTPDASTEHHTPVDVVKAISDLGRKIVDGTAFGGPMKRYDYEVQKKYVFTDEGQRQLLRIRDRARDLIERSGSVSYDALVYGAGGDSWDQLACVERLVEVGDLVRILRIQLPNKGGEVFVSRLWSFKGDKT